MKKKSPTQKQIDSLISVAEKLHDTLTATKQDEQLRKTLETFLGRIRKARSEMA